MNDTVQTEELQEEVLPTEETEETEVEAESEEPKQSKSQDAKQRLRRKLRAAEEENLRLKEQAAKIDALERKLEGVANPPPPRPSRVDFETEEEYEDSLFEYRDTIRESKSTEPPQTEQKVQPLDVEPNVQKNWHKQIEVASEKYDDFDEVLVSIPKESMTDPMTLAIMENGNAGEIAYFLGNNPEEAERIANLSLVSQVNEINKLGNKFNSKTTSAPEPITPTKGGDSTVKDPEKMSPEEYADWRRKSGMGGYG